MERLIISQSFWTERSLAFGGSNGTLGLPLNDNFLGIVCTTAKRDLVLSELQNRIIWHKSKQYCFDNYIENKLINLIANEAEKVILTQLKQAEYFALIPDSTPDISHREQLTVILRFV